jgi:hypothetical protein
MAAVSSIAAVVTAAAAAASAANARSQGKKAEDTAKRAAIDAKNEKAKAEADAAARLNSRLATRNRARTASSLLSGKDALDSATSDVGALGGKLTLGQ